MELKPLYTKSLRAKNPYEKRGCKSTYDPENHPRIAYEFILAGGTQKKLSVLLAIHEDTIYEWIKKYPEFAESIQRAKDDINVRDIEAALIKRAKGYKYKEQIYEVPVLGASRGVKPFLTKEIIRHIPASDVAMQFFLKNRAPGRYPKNGDGAGDTKVIYMTHNEIMGMLNDEAEKELNAKLPPIKKGDKK